MCKVKPVISLILILVMLMTMSVGCSNGETTPTESESQSPASVKSETVSQPEPSQVEPSPSGEPTRDEKAQPEPEPPEPPVEEAPVIQYPLTETEYQLVCWGAIGGDLLVYSDRFDTLPLYEMAEQVTGVSIHIESCSVDVQPERMNLYCASMSMPDIMLSLASLYSGGGDKLIEDEIAPDISVYLESCMPNYSEYIKTFSNNTYKSMFTDAGNLVGIYVLRTQENFGLNIRQDWLDNLELEAPATYDELENVLLAFKNEYDIRNPIYMLNEFGYTNYGLAAGLGTMISATPAFLKYYQIDGVVYSGDFTDGSKDYLKMLAKWYQLGLFSDDCLNYRNIMDNMDMILKDGTGAWYSEPQFMTSTYIAMAQDPDFNVTPLPDIVKEHGQTLNFYDASPGVQSNAAWTVTSNCEDIELALKYIDWYFSEEALVMSSWGTEGLTFEYDAGGNRYYTELITNSTEYSTSGIALSMYTGTLKPAYQLQDAYEANTEAVVIEAGKIYRSNQEGGTTVTYAFTPEESEEYTAIANDILTYKSEIVSQIILGEKDISAYDDLVAYAEQMNFARCVELVQQASDRFQSR